MTQTATTRVLLVRHGATTLSAEDKFAGDIGVDLSDEGRAQVQKLAERLASAEIAAVYASPLGRTLETATIVAAPHDLPIVQRDALREIRHGRWEGLSRQEVEQRFAEEYTNWRATRLRLHPRAASRASACWRARCPRCARSWWRIPGKQCSWSRTRPRYES